MPRYFFHVTGGLAVVDTEGLELENDMVARTEALRGAIEMMADSGMALWLGNTWVMSVADEGEDFVQPSVLGRPTSQSARALVLTDVFRLCFLFRPRKMT